MKRKIFLFLTCLSFAFIQYAQAQSVEILNEEFRDGNQPAGWDAVDVEFKTSAGGFAQLTGVTGELTSPIIDLSGYTDVTVEFYVAKFGSGDNGPITFSVSEDGGNMWQVITYSPTPTNSTYIHSGVIDISDHVTANTVLRFSSDTSPSDKRFRDLVVKGVPSGDFPSLSIDPNSLSGFSHLEWDGPSASQSFVLTGENLDGNENVFIGLTDDDGENYGSDFWEISLDEDVWKHDSFTLSDYNGDPVTVYVRLNANFVGVYNDSKVQISGYNDMAEVTLSGEVFGPQIILSAESLSGFNYLFGEGPSDTQELVVSGNYLDGTQDVYLYVISNFELSTDQTNWADDVLLQDYDGDPVTVYVRLQSGLNPGDYQDEIVVSGYALPQQTVSISGSVVGAELSLSYYEMDHFTYIEGTGPATSKLLYLYGDNLDGSQDVVITAGDRWEFSTQETGGVFKDTWTIENFEGDIPYGVHPRLKGGLTEGDYNNPDEDWISFTGYGQTVSATLAGTVYSADYCSMQDFEYENISNNYSNGYLYRYGVEWNYNHSRNEDTFPIDNKGIMLRRASDSYLSTTVPDGVGVISFDYRKAYTGSATRQLELIVDGIQVAVTPVFGDNSGEDDTIYHFNYTINKPGQTSIKIKNVGDTTSNRQTVIDNLAMTCFSADYVYHGLSWSPNNPDGTNGPASTENDVILIKKEGGAYNAASVGNLKAKSLYLNVGAELEINGVLNISEEIRNRGFITFKSSEDQTGQFDTFDGFITETPYGDFVTEAYMPARRAFRFFSSSVDTENGQKPFIRNNWQEGVNNVGTDYPDDNQNPEPGYGTHITGSQTGANGFDATLSGNKSLFGFDNINQNWTNIANTDNTFLEAGTPYRIMIRGDRSINVTDETSEPTNTVIRTSGLLKTGDVTYNVSPIAEDPNFIGNPYQATVDMNAVIAASTNIKDSYFYVWDPMLGGQPTPGQPGGRGAYVTVSLPDGLNTSGSTANQYLQPGQAVFVETLNNGAASVTFKEEHKNVEGLHGKPNQTETAHINILMYETSAFENNYTASDGVLILFSENGDNEITEKDAYKYLNLDENISTLNGEDQFSIESRALPVHQETVPLYTDQYRYDSYVFKLSAASLPENINAYLWDKFTDTYTQFQNDGETHYAFELDFDNPESIFEERFEVVFEEEGEMNLNELSTSGIVLYPNPIQNNQFTLDSKQYAGEELLVKVFDMDGKTILNTIVNVPSNGKVKINLPASTSNGVHAVTVSNRNKIVFTSKIIKK